MELQIRTQMRRAMVDQLTEVFTKDVLTDSDIEWIVKLCAELVVRLNGLTPNRPDLHETLIRAVDVSLLEQMLRHDATDHSDVQSVIGALLERLSMLCAPIQDERVASLRGQHIGTLIYEANEIIDEIKQLEADVRNGIRHD